MYMCACMYVRVYLQCLNTYIQCTCIFMYVPYDQSKYSVHVTCYCVNMLVFTCACLFIPVYVGALLLCILHMLVHISVSQVRA